MANILNIGKTALNAAQIGLATTGHNIANASTPGYSRQSVVLGSAGGQSTGIGFLGKGTSVETVRRSYNEFLTAQVLTTQTSQQSFATHHAQIQQLNNMFADPTVGISPALQDFFKSVQNVAADPVSSAARQSLLSASSTLVGQFRSVDARLDELYTGVNGEIRSSVDAINGYARQIAQLNDSIAKVTAASSGQPPNDLLDQRDHAIAELSKEAKVSIVKQGSDYNVFIGNGQSLVVSNKTYDLTAVPSATDLTRMQVGYSNNGNPVTLDESTFTGGRLGGLFEFRSQTLDQVKNSIGRIAIGLTETFNAQHRLGQDLNGNPGLDFFRAGAPLAQASSSNAGTAQIGASVSDATALTLSDYKLEYAGAGPNAYRLTRLSDGAVTTSATLPMTVDGVSLNIDSGAPAAGDWFLIRPTAAGASAFNLSIVNPANVAAAAPIRTAAALANAGTGKISSGAVDGGFSAATVTPAVTLNFNAAAGELTGFPAVPVTVTSNGASVVYPPGDPVPYTDGATISFGGASFTLSGVPADGDTFTIGPNTNGVGDNRNMALLGNLQTTKLLGGGSLTYQSGFGQMVNMVGNKTRQVEVNSLAEGTMLAQVVSAQQAESGVNLDEEAANLLRYQQAYQAAGKVMQVASQLFDLLLSLGGR